jgi:hypothetical protein
MILFFKKKVEFLFNSQIYKCNSLQTKSQVQNNHTAHSNRGSYTASNNDSLRKTNYPTRRIEFKMPN